MTPFAAQLSAVQQAGEDHEWYPTTTEIIKAMVKSLRYELDHRRNHTLSFLDVGAGNGGRNRTRTHPCARVDPNRNLRRLTP